MLYTDERLVLKGIESRSEDITSKRHIRMFADGLNDVERWLSGNPKKWNSESSKNADASNRWDLDAGYEGSLKLARDGWPEGADLINQALEAIIPATGREGGRWGYSYGGGSVSVGRYLTGNPKCMKNRRRQDYGKAKVLRMAVNIVASAAVSAEQMANYGAALVSLVDRLESGGRRVHLDCIGVVSLNKATRFAAGWTVKLASEPVDLSALAFSIAHPAALRRIWFALAERTPKEVEALGYGRCLDALPEDMPDNDSETIIVDGINHEPGRCNTPTDALRFAIEQLNKAAVKAGHATVESPLVDEAEWLADLVD